MREELGLEARLSVLGDLVTYPQTPDLVARTTAMRQTAPARHWPSLRRLAPLAAGFGAILLIVAAILSASSGARAAVENLLERGGVNLSNGDEEGVYTTTHFEPRFKITLAPLYGVAFDTPSAFAPGGIQLEHGFGYELGQVSNMVGLSPFAIYRPWDWAGTDEGYRFGNVDIDGNAEGTGVGDGHQFFPTDAAEWLQKHPRLETSEPTSVTVGGIEGTQVDVKVATAACYDQECARRESVTLFYFVNPLTRDGSNNCCDPWLHPVTIYPGAHYRFIVLPVSRNAISGDQLVIVAGLDDVPPGCCPTVGEGYSFERDAQPMLDSIVFVGAVSGEAEEGSLVVFPLSSSPSSGQTLSGSARLAATGLGTGVHVVIHRTDQPYVVYLHDGSCENLGAVAYALGTAVPDSTVEPGYVSQAQLVTTVPARLRDLKTRDFAIAAYASAEDREPVACGDTSRRSP
jgi:hypothetical protein